MYRGYCNLSQLKLYMSIVFRKPDFEIQCGHALAPGNGSVIREVPGFHPEGNLASQGKVGNAAQFQGSGILAFRFYGSQFLLTCLVKKGERLRLFLESEADSGIQEADVIIQLKGIVL